MPASRHLGSAAGRHPMCSRSSEPHHSIRLNIMGILAHATGLRQSELLGVRRTDPRPRRRHLAVHDPIRSRRHPARTQGRGRAPCTATPPATTDVLRAHRERQDRETHHRGPMGWAGALRPERSTPTSSRPCSTPPPTPSHKPSTDTFGYSTDANGSSDPPVALSDEPQCATGR